MPLANAASIGLARSFAPMTVARAGPPAASIYAIARVPAASCAPDTHEASVSKMWCFVFSTTAGGSAVAPALAM
jgi:hypothetical protein